VLEAACEQAARWQREWRRAEPLTIAVNVSASQLLAPHFVDSVARTVTSTGLKSGTLILELTESVLVTDPDRVAVQLHRLRNLRVRVAIDDFGTGYSSLSYLRQFPVDILKVDRSFVRMITTASDLPPLVQGLLDLGHTLGLDMVAEGIEEPFQRDALRGARCENGQGYLFAPPLDTVDVNRMLRQLATERVSTRSTDRVSAGLMIGLADG
jgi:EAL domain-containing protein (putative c-di-GMP-specific phosphodiesterase class I)